MNDRDPAAGAEQPVVATRAGAVLTLRINRPHARNAMSVAVMRSIGAGVLEAESDPGVRAIVLTGTGDRAFCSGLDLKEFADGSAKWTGGDEVAAFHRFAAGQVPIPVVGAANGSAVGGGLELLLSCDVIVASSAAVFGLPEVKRGLFPGGGGTLLGTRIPLALALEMILTGDVVDAARAREIGLINAVADPEHVLDTALELAGRIAANAPLGLAACKELVRLSLSDPTAVTDRLSHLQQVVFASADAREGARAFMEKRTPQWQGK
jgi:enoyl-CoA hydratase